MADPTPRDWIRRLYPELTGRSEQLRMMDAFYSGDHPLPFLTAAHAAKMRSAFRQMLDESRSNFMRLVVDVVAERTAVEGFRLSADSSLETDAACWGIWQANHLDSLSKIAFVESLIKGVSYFSVWQDVDDDGYADIAIEDPLETIVAYTPGSNFRSRDAALKAWRDEINHVERATIYLPDALYKFQRPLEEKPQDPGTRTTGQGQSDEQPAWEPLHPEFGAAEVENPLGVVPIIPLRNRPRLLCEGESELADLYRIQNQINGFLFLLALAGYFGAHRQRWATGITLAEDEETKQIKEPFDIAIDKLVWNEATEARFGEFGQTDLGNFIKAIEQKVQHLAIVSRTPKHYLIPTGQEPSGDAIKSAESGLVKKIKGKQDVWGEALEEVMVLALSVKGKAAPGVMTDPDDLAPVDSETVWADPATESQAVNTDAVVKVYAAGLIPMEQALADLGYSQIQIVRIMELQAKAAEAEAKRQADALAAAAAAAPDPNLPLEANGDKPVPAEQVDLPGGDKTITPRAANLKPMLIRE